ncbi:MAG: hypothetical protein A4E64_03068 [Syntrophorhabdus sp. PtaU1.Bin058]|nr:MAG: hypothetical protein A4E64_03068 [Syntrophorhabdus sp. PtaU1.Bin058]
MTTSEYFSICPISSSLYAAEKVCTSFPNSSRPSLASLRPLAQVPSRYLPITGKVANDAYALSAWSILQPVRSFTYCMICMFSPIRVSSMRYTGVAISPFAMARNRLSAALKPFFFASFINRVSDLSPFPSSAPSTLLLALPDNA